MNRPRIGREREDVGREEESLVVQSLSHPTHEVDDRRNGMVNGTRGFKVVSESVVLSTSSISRSIDQRFVPVDSEVRRFRSQQINRSMYLIVANTTEIFWCSRRVANRAANGQYLFGVRCAAAVTTETDSTRHGERDRARGNRGISRGTE